VDVVRTALEEQEARASAFKSGGSTAWSTSIVLPAVPMLNLYSPG
jgi:hypothetical protein